MNDELELRNFKTFILQIRLQAVTYVYVKDQLFLELSPWHYVMDGLLSMLGETAVRTLTIHETS